MCVCAKHASVHVGEGAEVRSAGKEVRLAGFSVSSLLSSCRTLPVTSPL